MQDAGKVENVLRTVLENGEEKKKKERKVGKNINIVYLIYYKLLNYWEHIQH